jgi:NADH-quinone oxidoreductase subunit M
VARLLSLLLIAPVLGALAVSAVRKSERAARYLAIAAAAGAAIVSIALWFRYVSRGPEWQFTERIELLPSIGVSYALGIDGLSLSFVVLTTIVALLSVWCIEPPYRTRGAYVAMLVLDAGLLGAYVSLDLLLQILFWGAAFGAGAALARVTGASRRLGFGLAAAAVSSAVPFIAGVLTLDAHYHSLASIHSLDVRAYQQLSLPPPLQTRLFLAFLPALVLPLAAFLALARTATRGPAWLMLPGVLLLNMSLYGLLRVSLPILPDASRRLVPAMLWVAIVVLLASAIAAVLRRDWRRSIASACVAYAALAALGALTLTPDGLAGAIVQHVALTLSIAAIVLVEGRLRRLATRSEAPVLLLVLLIGTLSLAGVPPLAGFVGLRRTVEGVWSINRAAGVVLVAATVVSAISLWRLYLQRSGRESTETTSLRPWDGSLVAVPAMLSLWIGTYPAPLLNRIETAVARVVMRVSPQYAAEVADCLSQPGAPPPAIPGLPSGMVMVAPCADGAKPPAPVAPVR